MAKKKNKKAPKRPPKKAAKQPPRENSIRSLHGSCANQLKADKTGSIVPLLRLVLLCNRSWELWRTSAIWMPHSSGLRNVSNTMKLLVTEGGEQVLANSGRENDTGHDVTFLVNTIATPTTLIERQARPCVPASNKG